MLKSTKNNSVWGSVPTLGKGAHGLAGFLPIYTATVPAGAGAGFLPIYTGYRTGSEWGFIWTITYMFLKKGDSSTPK